MSLYISQLSQRKLASQEKIVATFDALCGCSDESDTHSCLCMRWKDQAGTQCAKCLAGTMRGNVASSLSSVSG